MNTRNSILITGAAAMGLILYGCGKGDSHEGHDHANGEHAEQVSPEGGGDHDAHAEMHPLGDVTIGATTLLVAVGGEVVGGEELHVNIEHKEGDVPSAVRLWVGDEDGTDAVKSKADGAEGNFHGHVEVPAELTEGSMLWIEIETAGGERHKGSAALN